MTLTGRSKRIRGTDQHVGPELVFAVACPVGTPDEEFHRNLVSSLHAYGYETKHIKLSSLLTEQAGDGAVDRDHEETRISKLMDVGDDVCKTAGSQAAVALLGVSEIRELRIEFHSVEGEWDVTQANEAIPRTAYILDSLKRPAEVTQLRRIYGDHLLMIGLQASRDTRVKALTAKIKPQRAASLTADQIRDVAEQLIERDLSERDAHGQNMLKTFPMADVFIDVDQDVPAQIQRVLDLLFENPDYHVPTPAEYGMHLAYISSTRSPELGLKVGAALMCADDAVVSLGVNTHPKPSGSPEFDASALDIRELVVDTLRSLKDSALTDPVRLRLEEDPDGYCNELLSGPLKTARIRDLTEFQPTVHAEMSAILEAVRRGDSVENGTMYVTAFPCHNCAKHIVALDLKLIYLEPYPKSRAGSMYGSDVETTFLPFSGVAPRRYQALFEVGPDRKNPDGSRKTWSTSEMKQAQPRVDSLLNQQGIADREASAIRVLDGDVSGTDKDLSKEVAQ